MYQKRCYLAVSRFGHVERRLGLDEEKRVEEEEVVNTAEETKPLTESPGPSCGNNSNVVLCCICSNHVCTTDFTVSCRAEHCLAIAHYLCAGYHSEKGAKGLSSAAAHAELINCWSNPLRELQGLHLLLWWLLLVLLSLLPGPSPVHPPLRASSNRGPIVINACAPRTTFATPVLTFSPWQLALLNP